MTDKDHKWTNALQSIGRSLLGMAVPEEDRILYKSAIIIIIITYDNL